MPICQLILNGGIFYSNSVPHIWSGRSLIPSRALGWGSWAQSPSVSPISLITGRSLHSASMTFPESQWADSSSC